MKIRSFLFGLTIFLTLPMSADDFIAVGKEGNVFDQPNGKYITENQAGDEVSLIPGMVFKTSEHQPGWYKVEYSPGLHAYLPEQIVAASFNKPQPGKYNLKNNPAQTITIQNNGDKWTAEIDGKEYAGNLNENILIFIEEGGNIVFSLVDLGDDGIAITYDNNVTNFF